MLQWQRDQTLRVDERSWLHANLTPGAVCVVISTPAMLGAAIKWGSARPVFMDATHGVIKYGYKLVTLLVMDDHGKGVPVAWGFLEHERAEDYETFLAAVNSECVRRAAARSLVWRPSCILTDDAPAEHKAARCDSCKPAHAQHKSWIGQACEWQCTTGRAATVHTA